MTNDPRLTLAAHMGVLPGFHDLTGIWRDTSVETAVALLAGIGVNAATWAEAEAALAEGHDDIPEDVISRAGERAALTFSADTEWRLTFEDGTTAEGRGSDSLPVLPLGIHRLQAGGRAFTLLAAPHRLSLPDRCWGLIAPLYGLSQKGIGSYDDLAALASGMGGHGASFIGINPVHAGFPVETGCFSPYTPSHRRRLNVLHLAGGEGAEGPLIDYARDIPGRRAALRTQYTAFDGDERFDAWRAAEGESLALFALHQALSERHGAYWCDWPAELHVPSNPRVLAARAELEPEMRFHAWLQWRADSALSQAHEAARQAGMKHGLYLDLAVGTHPFGAETWEDPGSFAVGISLGAPPDPLGPDGQNWNLAPFNPLALRARAYAPFAETLRRHLRFAGVLRIDHVLGFERAFWVPRGLPGAYMRMPRDAMLAVTRIEAARRGAVIVGEDLGVLPDGLQAALAQSGILGCRVAMFERDNWEPPQFRAPEDYEISAIASFSTHDLPTWRGWRSGADIGERARIAGKPDEARGAELAFRATEVAALDSLLPDAGEDALHDFLARTPSALVGVQAEILLGMEAQPNLPGTVDEYPNWRIRLTVEASRLAADARAGTVARIMRGRGRSAL
ncbi:MAG: 4-alpha-glucanotransferase [Rhizobiales bacterium]|nr:4-alpha-glucanotransferase [Hyphomicrobiales bacterium]